MRMFGALCKSVAVSLLCMGTYVMSVAPPMKVSVTLRGKRYDISASTVGDLQAQMEEKSGLKRGQQAVLFKGKQLGASDALTTAGVAEGDTLNIVPTKASVPKPRPKAPIVPPVSSPEVTPSTSSSAGTAAGTSGGPSTPDELLSMLNGMLGNSGLGGLAAGMGGNAGDAAKMFEGMDMTKLARMYQAFIWKLVRSPIVKQYLESDEMMEELRTKLKETYERVADDPKVAAQMGPLITEDFKDMMEDTSKFRSEIQKVVDFYMTMPDPDADGTAFSGFDPSILANLAKSGDEDDDLDNLPDDDKSEL